MSDWRSCDDGSFKYQPRQGDAVLFWGVTPDLEIDQHALHGGCPVKKGEKWAMTKWIRSKVRAVPRRAGMCMSVCAGRVSVGWGPQSGPRRVGGSFALRRHRRDRSNRGAQGFHVMARGIGQVARQRAPAGTRWVG